MASETKQETTPAAGVANIPAMVETHHNFFKQQRAMNFRNYLKLKQEEELAMKRHQAAILTQRVFRGWFIRNNMRLLHDAATKIQAAWKAGIARQQYKILDKERKESNLAETLDKMATKIQATWRGHTSRKNIFSYKRYEDLQSKNQQAEAQAKAAADLESMFSVSRSSFPSKEELEPEDGPEATSKKTSSAMVAGLENLLNTNLTELAHKMSPTRVAQLFDLAKSNEPKIEAVEYEDEKRWRSRLEKLATNLHKAGQVKRCAGTHDDSLTVLMEYIEKEHEVGTKWSSFYMFPELPDSDDYIRPDSAKVEVLREAIRLLRDSLQRYEVNKLAKVHYLMRTAVIPGVYSDIFTNELTDMEKKLKSLKFLEKKPAPENGRKGFINRGKIKLVPGGNANAPPASTAPKKFQSRFKLSSRSLAQIRFKNKNSRGAMNVEGDICRISSSMTASPCSGGSKLINPCSTAWKHLSKC